MDQDKKAEVVHLFQEMAKGLDARPKPARKAPARSTHPCVATIIVGSTVVVVQDPEKTALVARLINLIARK